MASSLERNAVDGQAFKAGDVLFRLADHSVVWVMADVAEGDIDAVRPGQPVTRDDAGRIRAGRSRAQWPWSIPHLMKETRTARVRIELPNPDLALLPDMYARCRDRHGLRPTTWSRSRPVRSSTAAAGRS